MKFSALSRTGFAVALSAVLASMATTPAHAELNDSIFAKVSPSIRDRMFFRMNYIYANVKTTSGDAYDVTGPVLTLNDLRQMGTGGSYVYPRGSSSGLRNQYYRVNGSGVPATTAVYTVLRNAINEDGGCVAEAQGLGTPCGIRARGQATAGTPAISLGYYLDDDYSWAFEAYLIARPLDVSVYGDGRNHLNGQKIIGLKLLPPTAVLGKYFGGKDSSIRPFVGVGGSYAIFYDAHASDFLNTYQGGGSPGDTTVKVKNAFGVGPFVGLKVDITNDWHLSLNVGKLRYKTEATLTTRNTTITDSSLVLQDYGAKVQEANSAGVQVLESSSGAGDGITQLMCDLAAAKYNSNSCNLGTFTRKTSTTLDNTMFMLAIGRSF